MLEGVQTGYYWTEYMKTGIYIEISDNGYGVNYRRVHNGELGDQIGQAILKEVYDENQGNKVAGIELTDVNGYPTGETFKLRDFQMSGNLRWLGGLQL